MIKKLILKIYVFLKKCINPDQRTPLEVAIDEGLTVGKNFKCLEGTIIDPGHVSLITIGDNVTLAPNVHILAHDASTRRALGYTMLGKVDIGNDVFVGANSTILPGVSIGDNSIIGANSLVSRDVPANCVYAGNPAKMLMTTEEYFEKRRRQMEEYPVFGMEYYKDKSDEEHLKHLTEEVKKHGYGFVK